MPRLGQRAICAQCGTWVEYGEPFLGRRWHHADANLTVDHEAVVEIHVGGESAQHRTQEPVESLVEDDSQVRPPTPSVEEQEKRNREQAEEYEGITFSLPKRYDYLDDPYFDGDFWGAA